jgi:hypothetical protein
VLESLTSATFSELFAKVIAEAAAHAYDAWRRKAEILGPTARLRGTPQIVAECVRVARSDLGFFLDDATMLAFANGPEFEYVVADMVSAAILTGNNIQRQHAIAQCSQTLRLHGATAAHAALCTSQLDGLIRLILERATINPPDPDHDFDKRARPWPPGSVPFGRATGSDTRRRQEAQRQLQDQALRQITCRLDMLNVLLDQEKVNLAQVRNRVAQLRTALFQVHSVASPSHIDGPTAIPIEQIYVGPILESAGSAHSVPADFDRMLRNNSRLVVLGDPGGGKTSFTKYLTYLASGPSVANESYIELVMPVTLREHSADLSNKPGLDIIGAIHATALNHFQVELSRTEISYLCLTGRIFLILDGLDELLELRDRRAVTSSVNAFAALYPRCSIIATSRSVGYSQAALDTAIFATLKIASFSESQVAEYAGKWFALEKGLTPYSRNALKAAFLEESSSLSDLRSNPLLLSLMCSLYRHKRYIPKNRGQLYARCAELLFDDWDRSRRLRQKFEFDGRIDGAVRHLAYWIFTDQDKQSGVPEPVIRSEIAHYLSEWMYGNPELGGYAAKSFLDFCKHRAWILTETGTADDGSGLFQFSHRTFLEYFTAAYVVNKFSPAEICSLVKSHAADAAWYVVCQIVVQLASKKQQGLEDVILEELAQAMHNMPYDEKRIALALCARIIESISLRPETVKTVTEQVVRQFVVEMSQASVIGSSSLDAVRDRDSLWLDSERVAVENIRAARPVVYQQLNWAMRQSAAPYRELAHLIEFALAPDCTPETLAHVLTDENRARLFDMVSGRAWEAWIECAALLVQLRGYLVRPNAGMMTGNTREGRICPVRSRWNNRPLPNGIEIIVWLMAHGSDSIAENLDAYANAGIRQLAKFPVLAKYEPHFIWQNAQDAETRSPSYAPSTLRAGVRCALSLIEHSLENCVSEGELTELAASYIARPWGALGLIPPMISARYSIGNRVLQPAERTLIDSIGLTGWCVPQGVRAAFQS